MSGKHLDRAQQLKIYSLHLRGIEVNNLAERFGIHPRTVRNVIKTLKEANKS
jgi:DNA-binding Lrp family transcriptional regulator